MKSKIRNAKIIVLAFVTALAFTFVPIGISGQGTASVVDTVHAGDAYSITGKVNGLTSDGKTVNPGSTISISLDDLDEVCSGVKSDYNNDKIEIYWQTESEETFKDSKRMDTYYKDGKICSDVPKSESGRYYRLYVSKKSEYASVPNFNSDERFKVNSIIITILQGPEIKGVKYSFGFGSKNIIVDVAGYGEYYTSIDPSYKYVYKKIIKLWCNGKKKKKKSTNEYEITFPKVPMKYNANNTVKVQILMNIEGKEIPGGSKSYTVPGGKLGKNKVYATKISAKKASVRWSGTDGASGYRILKGNKKVKDVGSGKRKYVVKGKGAGKAKYKVIPFVKAGGKMYKGTSSTAKPKKNQFVTSNTGKPNGWVVEAVYRIKKVSLKGSTYTITGWGVNRAKYTKLKKFKKIKITLYCDGKKVLNKTIRNKRVNLKPQRGKKMTFRLKGKAGADLANGYWSYSVSVACDPSMLTPR